MAIDQSKILVLGGAGDVGEGIVRSLLKRGAHVIAQGRSASKLDRLRDYVADVENGQLSTVAGALSDPDEADALRDRIWAITNEVDGAVAAIGGWAQGYPINGVPFDDWTRIVADNLTSHFLAIKKFVPMLRPKGGTYVHINGLSAEGPYRGAGPVGRDGGGAEVAGVDPRGRNPPGGSACS
ncbi:SDR family NAD(P)-dependent oxidoreductase [Sphingopyxis sp. 550A]